MLTDGRIKAWIMQKPFRHGRRGACSIPGSSRPHSGSTLP